MIVAEPAILDLELDSAPESVALVRAGLKGLGSLLGFEPELLEDLQMVTSEACNNVILHAYGDRRGPLGVRVMATREGVDVLVRDHGAGLPLEDPEPEPEGLGLAVIRSLADRAELIGASGGGTEVHIEFEREIAALSDRPVDPLALPAPPEPISLPGDVVATVSPVALLPGVLGRLTRALAAQARFSIDRFPDVRLVVDLLVGHVQRFASDGRVCFALGAEVRCLRLMIGPLTALPAQVDVPLRGELGPLMHRLVDRLEIEPFADAEMLYLTLSERGFAAAV